MTLERNTKALGSFIAVAVVVLTVTCSSSKRDAPADTPTPETTPTMPDNPQPGTIAAETTPTATGIWSALLQKTPFPYTTPLPNANPTILDGTYVKFDPRPEPRAGCRRCPPYPPEGGVWKLNLDKGIFRIFHERTGWLSLGSFALSGDRIALFNDPHCHNVVGIYSWQLREGQLTMKVIEDECGIDLRARRFAGLSWSSCQPASTEAAITGHWPIPDGCRDNPDND